MAKNFHFFKFIASEWLTGDIVFEDFATQGLFINICALYWQRDGNISHEDLVKRYKNIELLDNLIGKYIHIEKGNIEIKFLNEQLVDANHVSKVNSENGKKGAEAKRKKATAKQPLSDPLANFSKEKKRKKELNESKLDEGDCEFSAAYDKKATQLTEMFKRVKVWQEWEVKVEVGKFLNKYPDIDLQKSGGLINTWAANHQPAPIPKSERHWSTNI